MMYSSFNARALGLDLTAEAAMELAARSGFEGVDLMVRDLVDSGDDCSRLRRRMEDLGLRAGAWPLAIRWRDTSEAEFQRQLVRLPRYADSAATLGLTRTGTWVLPEVPPLPGLPADIALDVAFDLHLRRLGAILDVLDRFQIRLGLEVIGVESFRAGLGPPFITGLAHPRLGELARCLQSRGPSPGILVDTWHLYAASETIDVVNAWGVERVVWVHVADLPAGAPTDRRLMVDDQRGLPGEHEAMTTRDLLLTLSRGGYDGPITPEPLNGCRSLAGQSPEQAARRVAEALQEVWPKPDAVMISERSVSDHRAMAASPPNT
jgi:sugar phosphate isomerase/epimerase